MRYFYNLFNKKEINKEPKKELYSLNEVKSRLGKYLKWSEEHPVLHFFDSLQARLHFLPSDIRYQWKLFLDFFRRGKRGFGNTDTWNLSSYLSKVIYLSLIFLKNTKMGCPILYGYDEAKDPECEENSKQWNDILDKMIETFKIAEKIANQDYIYFSTKDNSFQEWLRCYEQMKKIHEECSSRSYNVHIMDFGECQYYEEGFDLFRKYFFALWD